MKLDLRREDIISALKNFSLVVLGTISIAISAGIFIVPFNLVTGGMSGLAVILDKIIDADLEFVTIDFIITILTWIFFFAGLIILGHSFALKTLVSTIVYPIAFSLFHKLSSPDVLGGYFYLPGSEYSQLALVMGAVLGGALLGLGCALAFIGGGSTGGTDIVALTICKIFPRLKSSSVVFAVDGFIVILGMFVIGDIVISTLGIVSAMVSSLLIDKVFLGGSKSFIAQIVSDKCEEINSQIIEKVKRGSTIVDVTGGYSLKPKKMIIFSFTMRQYREVLNIINKTDKYAFVTFHRAHEINGEGWTR